jgi:hypothetical protein
MSKHPWRFWVVSLILAWSFDLLFWKHAVGLSFLIWVVLALVGAGILSVSEKKRPSIGSFALALVAAILAAITVLRQEPFTRLFSFALALFSLSLLACTYLSSRWLTFRFVDYLIEELRLVWAGASRPAMLAGEMAHSQTPEENRWQAIRRGLLPIVRGLLLAVPVVLVLGLLLASADLVFSSKISSLVKLFNINNWFEYLFRLTYILVMGYVITGFYLHALLPGPAGHTTSDSAPASETPKPVPARPLISPFLGSTEAFIVLGSVNLLFAAFVIIQFAYLFGGQSNITSLGFTYSDYARRGFSELVFVAILSFGLYLALATVTRLKNRQERAWLAGLTSALMILVLVILASALQRLLLYENAYGFTRIRTYTHILIIWMAIPLLASIALEIADRRRHLPLALLLALMGFGISFGALNIDGYIVQQNVRRTAFGEKLDAKYINTLSDDATPELFSQFYNPSLPSVTHDVIGAELTCRMLKKSQETPAPWVSSNWADYTARLEMVAHHLDLDTYPVTTNPYGERYIHLPDQDYYCVTASPLD